MNISALFIHRPAGTTLLTIALALAGLIAYQFLPVAPLPQVEFPTIQVQAQLPGASPEIMASAVATPLERQFGRIAGLNEMTSTSYLGSTNISLQFDLSRNIDAAARDVQAAINAARGQLPTNLPSNPFYRKTNPADSPVLILSLTSEVVDRGRMYDIASSILQQKLAQVPGVGRVIVGGGALPPQCQHHRANDPTPCAGLTPKPPGAACAHAANHPPPPPHRRPWAIDPARHCCPHAGCDDCGGRGLGTLRIG
jgi:multidrug efflux pump